MSYPDLSRPYPPGSQSRDSLLEPLTQTQSGTPNEKAMAPSILGGHRGLIPTKGLMVVVASYVFDWVILVALGVTGYIMAEVTPNKRPFWLADPNIS